MVTKKSVLFHQAAFWLVFFGIGSVVFLLGANASFAQSDDVANQQHAVIGANLQGNGSDVAKSRSNADQWYTKAGLGLFIHWGISAVEGKHELSWALMDKVVWNPNPLTPESYFKLADSFNPQKYDPLPWLIAAKKAGFGYAALTTRHHDGYALWPSQYGEFGTRTKMGGRDLVRPYVEACRKAGIKVGFYYSPPDWYFNRNYMSFGDGTKGTPESPHLGLKHEPVELPKKTPEFEDAYIAYINGQLTELLTNYGKIDFLWFDGGAGPKVLSTEQIRAMQPGIVINDRQHGVAKADFRTDFEGKMPTENPKEPWEHCFSMGCAWGYLSGEPYISNDVLLSRLVRARTWGGNVLANFAPRPTGEMPEKYYQRMDELANWMATRSESVIDVLPGPYPEQSNVPVTVRDKRWYVHLLPKTAESDGFFDTVKLTGVKCPQKVAMLGDDRPVEYHFEGDTLTITVPESMRTQLVDVIAVDW